MIKLISQKKLKNKDISFTYAKNLRVILICLYWFAIEIDLGKKFREKIGLKRFKQQFEKKCKVCNLPLNVNSWGQIVFYHKECRKYRNRNVLGKAFENLQAEIRMKYNV